MERLRSHSRAMAQKEIYAHGVALDRTLRKAKAAFAMIAGRRTTTG